MMGCFLYARIAAFAIACSFLDAHASGTTLGAFRAPVKVGAGNELCWQSLFDAELAEAALSLRGSIGRYPGGTPSDYWDFKTGWGTDVSPPIRRATPRDWSSWTRASNITDTVIDVNQLTHNLSYAIEGLRAHETSGTRVKFIELGNEMYDSSRTDVLEAYPQPVDYAKKMALWIPEIKAAFPSAQIALIGVRWDPASAPERELAWNKQVLQGNYSLGADAATIHIYCGGFPSSDENVPAPDGYANFLGGAEEYVDRNRQNIAATIPLRLRVWVTELGVYPPAGPLDGTWLQAIYFGILISGLSAIPRIDMVLPYCLVCADKTGPSITTKTGPIVNPNVKSKWYLTPKGIVQREIYSLFADASTMAPLVLGVKNVHGWYVNLVSNASYGMFLLNKKNETISVNLPEMHSGCTYKSIFPKLLTDATLQGLVENDLGIETAAPTGIVAQLYALSVTTIVCK